MLVNRLSKENYTYTFFFVSEMARQEMKHVFISVGFTYTSKNNTFDSLEQCHSHIKVNHFAGLMIRKLSIFSCVIPRFNIFGTTLLSI